MSEEITVTEWNPPRNPRPLKEGLSQELRDLVSNHDVMIREIEGKIWVFLDSKGKRFTQR